jgi:FkbM family methyltransferase
MSLIDRIFSEPELRAAPPVLVDVGAAGGVHPAWRRIARHAIGVGFEPDAREAAPLAAAQRMFARWIFCRGLAVPAATADGRQALHLTRSPQCSSTLRPRAAALGEWAFAEFFEVTETRMLPATTIAAALAEQGIARVDWLKCDTQGLDLKLFLSLPETWRARMLAVEFEPGLIDAYEGEDRLGEVLTAMTREPFWLAELEPGRTPRGRPALLAERLGAGAVRWVRRLAPGAPAWANARYLREVGLQPETLDRRAHLLAWVFATITGEHGYALTVAAAGAQRFGGELFGAMAAASGRSLRWAMVRGIPAMIWRRVARTWAR